MATIIHGGGTKKSWGDHKILVPSFFLGGGGFWRSVLKMVSLNILSMAPHPSMSTQVINGRPLTWLYEYAVELPLEQSRGTFRGKNKHFMLVVPSQDHFHRFL